MRSGPSSSSLTVKRPVIVAHAEFVCSTMRRDVSHGVAVSASNTPVAHFHGAPRISNAANQEPSSSIALADIEYVQGLAPESGRLTDRPALTGSPARPEMMSSRAGSSVNGAPAHAS